MVDDYPVRVLRVIDGDSVVVRLPDGDERSVRMYGIDAPERAQARGEEARRYLERVVDSRRHWRLEIVDIDRYERLVGLLYPDGETSRQSANHAVVEQGLAYWYREYGGAEYGFDRAERRAKQERLGVWSESGSVKPWDFRRAKRAEHKRRREAAESPWVQLFKGVFTLVFAILKVLAVLAASSSGGSGRRRSSNPLRPRRRRRRW